MKVWDAGTGQEVLVLKGHTDMVTSVAFSADGKRIFAWDAQKKVLAWSAADGKPIDPVDPPPAPPPGPARSPDGFRHAMPQGNTIARHRQASATEGQRLAAARSRRAKTLSRRTGRPGRAAEVVVRGHFPNGGVGFLEFLAIVVK